MKIRLLKTNDEPNKLNKTYQTMAVVEGSLLEGTSIINPSVVIEHVGGEVVTLPIVYTYFNENDESIGSERPTEPGRYYAVPDYDSSIHHYFDIIEQTIEQKYTDTQGDVYQATDETITNWSAGVNTGTVGTEVFGIETEFKTNNQQSYWSSLVSSALDDFTIGVNDTNIGQIYVRIRGSENMRGVSVTPSYNVYKFFDGIGTINGVNRSTYDSTQSLARYANPLYLGTNSGLNRFTSTSIKYTKIYGANNELIRDLRPCSRNGVAYMFDVVSNTAFGKVGSGALELGQPIPPIIERHTEWDEGQEPPTTRTVEISGIPDMNYMYIDDFSRFYFINDVNAYIDTLFRVSASCDVLMSFRDKIKELDCIVSRSQSNGDKYIQDGTIQKKVYNKIKSIDFPNAFSRDLQYVLAINGGE